MKFSHMVSGAALAAATIGMAAGAAAGTVPTYDITDHPPATQVVTTQQYVAAEQPKPLVGDFDGDGQEDIFWYVPGAGADPLWLGKEHSYSIVERNGGKVVDLSEPDRFEVVTTLNTTGTYTPVVGDFDGDGRSDILWYAPGKAPDGVWYFGEGNTVTGVSVVVNGLYTPVAGNFDLTGESAESPRDDIFWYAPNGGSGLWTGNADRTFTGRGYLTNPPQKAQVYAGNWRHSSGTPTLDLMFYRPGTGADGIWVGDGTGAFTAAAMTVNGTYTPVVGQFNVEAVERTDVIWYGPGSVADSVWMNSGTGWTSISLSIGSNYKPLVVPTDASNRGDLIVWNEPTGSADRVWTFTGTSTSGVGYSSRTLSGTHTDPGGRLPVVGDFDRVTDKLHCPPEEQCVNVEGWDHETSDVLWYAPGNTAGTSEQLWLEFSDY